MQTISKADSVALKAKLTAAFNTPLTDDEYNKRLGDLKANIAKIEEQLVSTVYLGFLHLSRRSF